MFTSKHTSDIPLENLSQAHFLTIAVEAAKKLDWKITAINENEFIANTRISPIRLEREKFRLSFANGIAQVKSKSRNGQFLDWGSNHRNIEQFKKTFDELKNSLSEAEVQQKYEELKPVLLSGNIKELSQPSTPVAEQIKRFGSTLIPREGFFVMPILIYINVGIFIVMVLSGVSFMLPDNADLIKWGANLKILTLNGQWWRLLTCCFVHIGLIHLLLNMYALLYIGPVLESILGKTRFAVAYFLTGIISSLTSLYWYDNILSAGASGAIFGMYGVFFALLTTNFIERSGRKPLLTSIGVFVVFNLMNGVKPGIDNAAHVGGLIGGLIIGYIFYFSLREPQNNILRYGTLGLVAGFTLIGSAILYHIIPNDLLIYQQKMTQFDSNEKRAMASLQNSKSLSHKVLKTVIADSCIYYYKENRLLAKDADKLGIPKKVTL